MANAPVKVKICGLSEERGLQAALDGGAAYVGFVFFRRSPRFVDLAQAAALVAQVPRDVTAVGLFVDPTDADLDTTLTHVPLGMIQLHGKETPARVSDVKKRTGLPVMKALGISTAADVAHAAAYADHADMLLFDAKPPSGATRPGGNAVAFDWTLMRTYGAALPWFLAGGLTRDNVADAIRQSGAALVDVSSGVESQPGVKSPAMIRAFLAMVAAAK
jgi:phosphoribosylanthranilate isomerase